jgi:DNA-binding PadR family transcriptional regulator
VLGPLDLIILVTLSSWPDGTHGYQLLQAVRAEHDPDVATTSLYRAIRGLLDRGLIAEVALAPGEDPRRRRYQVTGAGFEAAKTERTRLLRLFATSPRLAGVTSPRLARATSPRLAGVTSPRLAGVTSPRLAGVTSPRLAGAPS